jgi:hypothetical protein
LDDHNRQPGPGCELSVDSTSSLEVKLSCIKLL